jgi:hypothetical protein
MANLFSKAAKFNFYVQIAILPHTHVNPTAYRVANLNKIAFHTS